MQSTTTQPMPSSGVGPVKQKYGFYPFDYSVPPACARSCKVLATSEHNCVPPVAPASNAEVYTDCICQSGYLRSLHASGVICHDVCSEADDQIIYHYYNNVCGTPMATVIVSTVVQTSPSIKSSTAVATATNSSVLLQTSSAMPTPTETHQAVPKDKGTWLHQNGKYISIAAGIVLAIVLILTAVLYTCRRKSRNARLKNSCNRPIPLQLLASPSTQPRRSDPHSDWALRTPGKGRLNDYRLRSPSLGSPLASSSPRSPISPLTPTYRMGETLRAYAPASRQEDEAPGRRSSVREPPATPVRSITETERLIRERILLTGRPDISLSATPKVRR